MRILYFMVVVFSKFYFDFLRCVRSKRVILDCVAATVASRVATVASRVRSVAMRCEFKCVTKDGNCPFH